MTVYGYVNQQAIGPIFDLNMAMLKVGNRIEVNGALLPIERILRLGDTLHVDLHRDGESSVA